MLRLTFTSEIITELDYWRYHHPHPRVQKKMEVLYLKAKGLSNQQIGELTGICPNTLRSYFKQFGAGGVPALQSWQVGGDHSELEQHTDTIETYFRQYPALTLKQAAHKIEELTGIKRSPKQVGIFLKKLGVKRLKSQAVPAKFDQEAQAEFKTDQLEPRLEEAKVGLREVFFVDAAHFVLGAFVGFLWCFSRVVVRAPSGRQRFNVLGALNAISHEVITVTNQTYINAESVCELLEKLKRLELRQPITLVLDNARYQRCRLVMERAAQLDIELLFLPPYSPNLNLIERLWKFVRAECLASVYYEHFEGFKQAISACLAQTTDKHKTTLDSWLSLKFQTLKNAA